MKKLLLFILSLLPMVVTAQSKQSAVTLKNGTTLQGVIKSIDPTDAITIVIAGVETNIKMDTVLKIEEIGTTPAISSPAAVQEPLTDKLRVTDFANYPETFDLKVGSHTIKMILVRGGDMNMGYDGDHSLSMKSEPVHKVRVSSFYISEEFIRSEIVNLITVIERKKDYYEASTWEKANEIRYCKDGRITCKTSYRSRMGICGMFGSTKPYI